MWPSWLVSAPTRNRSAGSCGGHDFVRGPRDRDPSGNLLRENTWLQLQGLRLTRCPLCPNSDQSRSAAPVRYVPSTAEVRQPRFCPRSFGNTGFAKPVRKHFCETLIADNFRTISNRKRRRNEQDVPRSVL